MKNKIILATLVASAFSLNVLAEGGYYKNQNGISMTEDEYKFAQNFYFNGYQDYMTLEDYKNMKELMKGEIEIVEYKDSSIIKPYGTSFSTPDKTVKIASSCASDCTINVSATWEKIPIVKSYDLLGAFIRETYLLSVGQARMFYGGTIAYATEINKQGNGVSATYKLPTTNNKLSFNLDFKVDKSGRVNGSYQHAKINISIANSRKYTFSNSGFGGVFLFNNGIGSYYDAMSGVSIDL